MSAVCGFAGFAENAARLREAGGVTYSYSTGADKTEIHRCSAILYVRAALACVGIYDGELQTTVASGRDETEFHFFVSMRVGFRVQTIYRRTN